MRDTENEPSPTVVVFSLVAIALVFRPQIVMVGPLAPLIQPDLAASHSLIGALSSILVLCMGVFAVVGPPTARRVGARRAIAVGALLVIAFGLFRTMVDSTVAVLVLTLGIGIGMGMVGPVLPMVVRTHLPQHAALGTGAYASGMVLGGALAAVVAVPLAGAGGDWRYSMAIISLAGLVPLGAWLLAAVDSDSKGTTPTLDRPVWRRPLPWLLGLLFGLQAIMFYGSLAWLAPIYVEHGWSTLAAATLVAAFNLVGLVATIVVPLVADRIGSRQLQLTISSGSILVAVVGIALVPSLAYPWVVVLGFGTGAIFPIALTLPIDAGGGPSEVAATATFMLLLGYPMASLGPLVLGLARDVTGDFLASLSILLICSLVLVVVCVTLSRERFARLAARP